jgi:PAS domain S-box-containing protein
MSRSQQEIRPFADVFHRHDLWLGSLIRNNPLATVVVDSRYRIQICNAAFETLFGYREEDVVGEPIDALITGPETEHEALDFNRRASQGEPVRAVTRRRRKDGTFVDVEVDIVPLAVDGEPVGAYGIYRNLTAEKRAERLLSAQYSVVRALAECETLESATQRILQAVGERVGFQVGVVFIAGADGRLECLDIWHAAGMDTSEFEAATRQTAFGRGEGFAGRIWAAKRPGWIVDVSSDESFPGGAVAQRSGLHAAFGFPILSGVEAFGVVEFFSTAVLEPDDNILRMFASVGNQLGAFIERRRAQRELERFFAMSLDMLCIAGFDGYFKRINTSWENVMGYTWAELVTKPYLDLVHSEDRETTATELRKLSDGSGVSFESRWRCSDGKYKWLHWSAMATPKQQTFYAVARDNTDRRAAEQQMREALKMKSDFVSFVTHQLRTPLSGIKWMLELARDAQEPDEVDSYVQDARESADRLISLVNDLLDVSRLESGKLQVSLELVDVPALTKSVLDDVAMLVREKGHQLVVDISPVPEIVADRQLLRQVILNLVSNAIKYTPAKGRIDVRIAQEDRSLNWSIRDSGIGISKASQARLFEKFYRAENALTIDTEGTGLGLYLVRLIVERFGGQVMCDSQEGCGTTFSVTLPPAGATIS